MNPEISRRYGEQHRAELHRQAERRRVAAQMRRPKPARLAMFRAVGPLVGRLRLWQRRARGAGAPTGAQMDRRKARALREPGPEPEPEPERR